MCTSAYARALKRRGPALGKLHKARYHASPFSLYVLPRRERDTTALPCFLPPRPSRFAFLTHSFLPPVNCEARRSALVLRGWRQFGRCAVDVRCHVSSVYPAARVFTFGSTCMQAGRERGANIISGGDRSAPKKQLPSGNQKRGSLQKSTKGTFRWGRGDAAPRGRAENGLGGCFISSSLGIVSRLTAQRPGL